MKSENELLAGYFGDITQQYEDIILLEISKKVLGMPGQIGLQNILHYLGTTCAKYGALRANSWESSYKTQFDEVRQLMEKEEKKNKKK